MKKKIIHTIFSMSFFFATISCNLSSSKNGKNEAPEYIQPQISAFYDSIYTTFPGKILVTDDYVAWTEPHAAENFLHIIGKDERKELKSLGDIGSGPHDFTTPFIEKGNKNELTIYDFDRRKKADILIDSLNTNAGGITFLDLPYIKREVHRNCKLSDNKDLFFSPISMSPFGIVDGQSIYYSGKFPIDNAKLLTDDKFNYFQGAVAYNANNDKILYSTYSFRYMALYERIGNKVQLVKETKTPKYSIRNGRLKLGKNDIGVSEVALTKNYIVTAEYVNKKISKKELRLNNYVLPEFLCVYDYNLQLKKILDVKKPIMRIGGHSNSDTIYALVEDPDFKIVTITF